VTPGLEHHALDQAAILLLRQRPLLQHAARVTGAPRKRVANHLQLTEGQQLRTAARGNRPVQARARKGRDEPAFLEAHGYERPTEKSYPVGLTYSSQFFRVPRGALVDIDEGRLERDLGRGWRAVLTMWGEGGGHRHPPIGARGLAPQKTCVPSIPMRCTSTMLRTIDLAVAVPTPTGPPPAL